MPETRAQKRQRELRYQLGKARQRGALSGREQATLRRLVDPEAAGHPGGNPAPANEPKSTPPKAESKPSVSQAVEEPEEENEAKEPLVQPGRYHLPEGAGVPKPSNPHLVGRTHTAIQPGRKPPLGGERVAYERHVLFALVGAFLLRLAARGKF